MGIRSHLLCCAYRLDLATDLISSAYSIGRVTQFIVFIINQSKGYNIEILTKKDNFFVMLHVHVHNSLQKVFKIILHTS